MSSGKRIGWTLVVSGVLPYFATSILLNPTTAGRRGGQEVGSFYRAICTEFHPCDRPKNLTCDIRRLRCICAAHPDSRFVYMHDPSTGACVEQNRTMHEVESGDEPPKTFGGCKQSDYFYFYSPDSDNPVKCLKHVRDTSVEVCAYDSQCWKYFGDNATCSDGGRCVVTRWETETQQSAPAWIGCLVVPMAAILALIIATPTLMCVYRRKKQCELANEQRVTIRTGENSVFLQD